VAGVAPLPRAPRLWRWVVGYRRVWVPRLLAAVREHAPQAELRVLRSTADVRGFLVE